MLTPPRKGRLLIERIEMSKIRVLLVDDVPDIRLLLRITVSRDERFEVVGEAEDGEEAIRLAGELKPDVIILDLAMPKMDGLQAIPEIRKEVPGVRILVFSGFEAARIAAKAIASCADAYIEKGTSLKELTSVLTMIHSSPPKACALAV